MQLYDFGDDGWIIKPNGKARYNIVYLVMEYAEGGLFYETIIKNGCLNETDARYYFIKILEAIEYMQKEGICHRDLKLENIIVDYSTKSLKIVDFGYASFVHKIDPKSFLLNESQA